MAREVPHGADRALYRRGLVFMDQRKFRRAAADFARAAGGVPDARTAEARAKWCLEHEGDAEDGKASGGAAGAGAVVKP